MQYTLMTTLEAGDALDHYRLERTVARTGMATLFKATDMRDGRQVAIKIPHPEMEADPVLLERFRREQEIGQELDHPGVVKTFDSPKGPQVGLPAATSFTWLKLRQSAGLPGLASTSVSK